MKKKNELVVTHKRVPIEQKSRALGAEYHLARVNGKVVRFATSRVYSLARLVGALGGDSRALARKLKIRHTRMLRWMEKDGEIALSMQRGIDLMVSRLEATAVKIATGYKNVSYKTTKEKDQNGKVVKTYRTKMVDNVAPDGGMVKFLLQNRLKGRYPKSGGMDGVQVVLNFDEDDKEV